MQDAICTLTVRTADLSLLRLRRPFLLLRIRLFGIFALGILPQVRAHDNADRLRDFITRLRPAVMCNLRHHRSSGPERVLLGVGEMIKSLLVGIPSLLASSREIGRSQAGVFEDCSCCCWLDACCGGLFEEVIGHLLRIGSCPPDRSALPLSPAPALSAPAALIRGPNAGYRTVAPRGTSGRRRLRSERSRRAYWPDRGPARRPTAPSLPVSSIMAGRC
jgi:hypothetical protein